MKWSKMFVFAIVGWMLACYETAVVSSKPGGEPSKGDVQVNWEQVQVSKQVSHDQQFAGDVYPQITGLPDAAMQDRVNAKLQDFQLQSVNLLKQTVPKQLQDDPGTLVQAGCEFKHLKGGIASIVFQQTISPPHAAHPWTGQTALTLIFANGDTLTLADLFKRGLDYLTPLSSAIKKSDTKHVLETFPNHKFEKLTGQEGFYLQNDGVVIFFDRYEYTPGAFGYPEFKVLYSDMMNLIDTQSVMWRALNN